MPKVIESDESREAAKAARKARRRLAKEERQINESDGKRHTPRGHGARSERRGSVFVRWLLDTFGIERLRADGVVDVAGGRGEVCARLSHCHLVPCLLMDPRASMHIMEDTLLRRVGRHLPMKYRRDLEEVGYSERLRKLSRVEAHEFTPESALDGILVGMHADGATEAIIDYALEHDLSFAVVPCCVFAKSKNLFDPSTCTKSKKQRALSYESFCDYLQAKAPDVIRRTVLDFEGRNVVLYGVTIPNRISAKDTETTARSIAIRAMLRNEPLLFRKGVSTWRASQCWSDEKGNLIRSGLASCFPHDSAPQVAPDGHRSSVRVVDYLADTHWPPPTYLKDWHVPQFYRDGWCTTPPIFQCDWLGDWLRFVAYEDFDFCYIGPAGSTTPEHSDVLASFSWSANISGRKHWRLQPPYGTAHMFIDQGPHDLVFIPSDWSHSVLNVQDVCSVNRNWFNACAIDRVYAYLLDRRLQVVQALGDDCRISATSDQEWLWTVENVLRMDARLALSDLLAIIYHRLVRLFTSTIDSPSTSATTLSKDDAGIITRLRTVLEDLAERFDKHTLFLDFDSTRFPKNDDPSSWSNEAQDRARAAICACRHHLDEKYLQASSRYQDHLHRNLY